MYTLRRGVTLVPLLVLINLSTAMGIAQGSCVGPVTTQEALDQAPFAFVGTVTDLDYGGRLATFAVEDIWKGEMEPVVLVNGGPKLSELQTARGQGQEVFTSGDRSYEQGERYLVVAHGQDGAILTDNSCSATQPFSSDLEQFRPLSAHAPEPAPTPFVTADERNALIWGGSALLISGLGVVVARRRRRRISGGQAATSS